MRKIFFLMPLIGLLFLPAASFSHQPRIVSGMLTHIKNPEVSQAFYSELKGKPEYYQITSGEPFRLYVGILVPDLQGIDKDVSVEITREREHDGEQIAPEHEKEKVHFVLDGLNQEWTYLYEKFGGDSYYKGPELRSNPGEKGLPRGVDVSKGVYRIRVFSPDNEGKYVLVVGEKEEFPLSEIINTLFVLPTLKAEFFEKSPWTAYINLIGLFMAISVSILIGVIVTVVVIVRKIRKKRRTNGQTTGQDT